MYLLFKAIPTKPEYDKAVNDILSKSTYLYLKNKLNKIAAAAEKKISDFIIKYLYNGNSSSSTRMNSNKISHIVLIILAAILISIIIFVVIKAAKSFDKKNKVKVILGEKIEEDTTPDSLRKKALQYKQNNQYKEAVRFDFIALLLLMHEQNVIFLNESSTNYEISKYLKRNDFIGINDFNYLSDTFNYVWYGDKPCSDDLYKNWTLTLNKLWNEVNVNEKKNK